MPKLSENVVNYIRQLMQKGEYKNCTEISNDVVGYLCIVELSAILTLVNLTTMTA